MLRLGLAITLIVTFTCVALAWATLVDAETAARLLPYAEMSNHIYDKAGCTSRDCHATDPRNAPRRHELVLNWEEILSKSVSPAQTVINHRLLRADNRGKLRDADISDTGFNAALYKDTGSGKLTLVFEGTSEFEYRRSGGRSGDFVHANAANAIPGALGNATHYDIANAIVFTLSEAGIHDYDITGHSLGGSLAQYAALLSGKSAVVFNSAALNCRLISCAGEEHAQIVRVDTVGFDPTNFIATIGSRVKGTQFGSFVLAGLGGHGMQDMLNALRRRAAEREATHAIPTKSRTE